MPRGLSQFLNVGVPLRHGFAISIPHVVVRGQQVSLEHGVWVDGTCASTVVQLLMLDILEGLMAQLRRAPLGPELVISELVWATLVSCHEVPSTLVFVFVVDERWVIHRSASCGCHCVLAS